MKERSIRYFNAHSYRLEKQCVLTRYSNNVLKHVLNQVLKQDRYSDPWTDTRTDTQIKCPNSHTRARILVQGHTNMSIERPEGELGTPTLGPLRTVISSRLLIRRFNKLPIQGNIHTLFDRSLIHHSYIVLLPGILTPVPRITHTIYTHANDTSLPQCTPAGTLTGYSRRQLPQCSHNILIQYSHRPLSQVTRTSHPYRATLTHLFVQDNHTCFSIFSLHATLTSQLDSPVPLSHT